ncbi:hypothetical protein K470DRAFT_195910, partial [Piedraia hortae CBS 480.64]
RSSSPSHPAGVHSEARALIVRAFAPHVAVLPSPDTEELLRQKGIGGGLLQLLRPFGEHVQGKVTIRDSSGVNKSWDDFGIRFVGIRDYLDTETAENGRRPSVFDYKSPRLRTGGYIPHLEQLVERHLTFVEEQSSPFDADYEFSRPQNPGATSPFYLLHLRRLMSGLPLVPSETFSHPVALVITVSSRCAAPIEELSRLYLSSNQAEDRLPPWVHNEFLRYYVLVHDESRDDIAQTMALFDQMKRHFGLHCHLLRLISTQCGCSDEGSIKLPMCEWMSASEELAEIVRCEADEENGPQVPYILESDAAALRAFVREMVTQSIVPSMERASATWNDQVASRRRGLSGRFVSLSKRFTTFGGKSAVGPALGAGGGNYDSVQGVYRPDAAEAVMRKLADYAVMLRDYRLAHGTYKILCQDFKHDRAWKYYAAASEMTAVTALLSLGHLGAKAQAEMVDQQLESAYYSYTTRVQSPFYALRTIIVGAELLKVCGGHALDDAANWFNRLINDNVVGPVGRALIMERIASCCEEKKRSPRRRKAAFWHLLAADTWLSMDKARQGQRNLSEAVRLYGVNDGRLTFDGMLSFIKSLQHAVEEGTRHFDEPPEVESEEVHLQNEPLSSPHGSPVVHRKSLS